MSSRLDKKECYIGIDIGGTYIKAGVVSTDGKIWAQRLQNVQHENLNVLMKQIVAVIHELRQAGERFQFKGVGIGVPGLVSKKKSRISISPNMPYLNGVEFKAQIEQLFELPVWLENDAKGNAYVKMMT